MRTLKPIKLKKAFILGAHYIGSGAIRLWLPGGKTWDVMPPFNEKMNRLPAMLPYMEKLAIAFGFKKESGEASLMTYDFETFTPGSSPDPKLDRVISASVWGNDYSGAEVIKKGKSRTPPSDEDETAILEWLISLIKLKDPDILAGYFCDRYDMLIMIKRCKELGIKLDIGRDGSEPKVIYKKFAKTRFNVKKIEIAGRIHFDVFNEVIYDQSLIGIKGVGMKTVGKFLGIPHIIETDRQTVSSLSLEKLMNYNISDTRLTYILASSYLRNLVNFSEKMDIPLTLSIERKPSHTGNYIYGRDFLKSNEKFKGENQAKFPGFFARKGKKYQGGYVELFKSGLFRPVSKIDFVSLYPSEMVCFNLDPKSVELVKVNAYAKSHDPIFEGDLITIYDNKIGSMTCRINADLETISRTDIAGFLDTKADLKKRGAKRDPLLRSQYWMVKLILNALSGYHGNPYSKWGHFPVIVLVCALARWLLKMLCLRIPNKIEADTDGVYADDLGGSVEGFERYLRGLIPERYQSEWIKLDLDEYLAGIFTDEKNYVLKTKKRLERHGAGLKGKHLPVVCDEALEDVINAIFDQKDWKEAIGKYRDLSGYNLGAFTMRADLKKTNYKGNNLYAQLLNALKSHGVTIGAYELTHSVRYVKTVSGYQPSRFATRSEIDERYYRKRIADAVLRVLEPVHNIDKWEALNAVDIEKKSRRKKK